MRASLILSMAAAMAAQYSPLLKCRSIGIPTPPRISQRQRRKLHRQTRPHGWKGGSR